MAAARVHYLMRRLPVEEQVAAILNAAWMVRHYVRGGRTGIQAKDRARAIRQLGVVVRDSLASCDDYEAILAAVVDGLRPRNEPPF